MTGAARGYGPPRRAGWWRGSATASAPRGVADRHPRARHSRRFPERRARAEAAAARRRRSASARTCATLPLRHHRPADARDHDDAVFAEPDDDPGNPGGLVVWVAIADVAPYVRPGSALDREARRRGNCVYFPDRVVPMLPERLSNGLCSLTTGEDRACIAVRMVFDAARPQARAPLRPRPDALGRRASYEQAQAAVDGRPDEATGAAAGAVMQPLWAASRRCARRASCARRWTSTCRSAGSSSPTTARSLSIAAASRFDAHRLIEEFMIQANVAAAETLEAKRAPLIYRVHDPPSPEKLEALREIPRHRSGSTLARGQVLRTGAASTTCSTATPAPSTPRWSTSVLRARCQALLCAGEHRPFRPGPAAATPISPRRSAAMPTCSSTGR